MSFIDTIRSEIFENEQLDVYEKMCLLVLKTEEEISGEIHLSSEELAKFMGCGVATAKRSFDSLRIKGYFAKDYKKEPPTAHESAVIKFSEDVIEISKVLEEFTEDFKEGLFTGAEPYVEKEQEKAPVEAPSKRQKSLDPEAERRRLLAEYLLSPEPAKPSADAQLSAFISQKEKKESLVDEVIDFIEEKISFKEANILLGFAGNDVERIKEEYRKAKASQVSDTMGVLINALQKKPTRVVKSEPENTQVDTQKLRKMQAYRNNGLK